jgi:hypothetical protein
MSGRLLVVGGGIAGFGLARALSLRGVSGTLVERLPAPPGSGLGLNLPGNALRALATLGLADEVVDRGVRIRRREYQNKTGRLLFAVDEEAFWALLAIRPKQLNATFAAVLSRRRLAEQDTGRPMMRPTLVHVWSTRHRSGAVRNGLQRSPAVGRSRRLQVRSCGNRLGGRTLIRMRPQVQVLAGPPYRP